MMKITDEKRSYNRKYYLKNKADIKRTRERYEQTAEGIWVKFNSHKKRGEKPFDLDKEDFINWYQNQEKVCFYCRCNVAETKRILRFLKVRRRYNRLEVDRMNNDLGYSLNNIVLACAICNFHKSGFFSSRVFLRISKRFLRPKFRRIILASS
jgi:hypothetical protein